MQESDEEEDVRYDDGNDDGGGYNDGGDDYGTGVVAKAKVPLGRAKQQEEKLSGDRDEWKQKYDALVASRQQVAVVEEEIVVNKASVAKKQTVKAAVVQQPTPAKQPVAIQHTTPLTFMQIQAIQRSAVRLARSQEAELALNAMDTYYMMQGGS
jgi:hypothetical protein